MDRGAWQATVHGFAELDTTEQISLSLFIRFVIAFLPRSKCLLISWLQPPSAVILEPPKIKADTVSTVSPSLSHEVVGPDGLRVLNVEL